MKTGLRSTTARRVRSGGGDFVMISVVRPPGDAAIIRAAPDTPGCASHAKRWVLIATILGSSVAFLEGTIINVALPAIQTALNASVAGMQWIASGYILFLAALILVGGAAGDRFGRPHLFRWARRFSLPGRSAAVRRPLHRSSSRAARSRASAPRCSFRTASPC